jgi:signal transduction histidine kinase
MGQFDVTFTIDDMLRRLNLANIADEGQRMDFLASYEHDLTSRLSSLSLLKAKQVDACSNDAQRKQCGLAHHLAETCIDIAKRTMLCVKEHYSTIDLMAGMYIDLVKDIGLYFPLSSKLAEVGFVSDELQGATVRVDDTFREFIYSANLLFLPDNTRLDTEVYKFMDTEEASCSHEGISLVCRRMDPISVLKANAANYASAIMQLVFNAKDHAFNKQNDTYVRSLEMSFIPEISIEGRAEDPNQSEGLYIVSVKDNGFGIDLEGVSKISAGESFSSKPKNGVAHGIGIREVKNVAEAGGGSFWFNSVLGHGSEFSFCIPYSRKKEGVFYQE